VSRSPLDRRTSSGASDARLAFAVARPDINLMANPSSFAIVSQLQAGTARMKVVGELDIATVGQLEAEVGTVLARGIGELVLDLSGLTFIDSSALRLFIVLNDRAEGEDWQLSLIRPVGPALSIFQISGAEEHLPFIEDPEAR
jgi:anti-sigma B factor antagonist